MSQERVMATLSSQRADLWSAKEAALPPYSQQKQNSEEEGCHLRLGCSTWQPGVTRGCAVTVKYILEFKDLSIKTEKICVAYQCFLRVMTCEIVFWVC